MACDPHRRAAAQTGGEKETLFTATQSARGKGNASSSINLDRRTPQTGMMVTAFAAVIERLAGFDEYLEYRHDEDPKSNDQAVDIRTEHAPLRRSTSIRRRILYKQRRTGKIKKLYETEKLSSRRERSALEALRRAASSGVPRQSACATTPRDAIRSRRRRHD